VDEVATVSVRVGASLRSDRTALGQAPLFAGLLLISGWARRTAILWAILPPLAICFFESWFSKRRISPHLLGTW